MTPATAATILSPPLALFYRCSQQFFNYNRGGAKKKFSTMKQTTVALHFVQSCKRVK
jgi:hypothetical protein